MKKLNNLKWFSLGVFACLIVSIASTPAFASSLTKSAKLVYNNIKISLNGTTVTPKDVSGKVVEPFTINGTTYLPVRALSNALGLNVKWNSSTKTVELTNNSTTSTSTTTDITVNYPNTNVPTYTFITGRPLKENLEGAYIYNYNENECIDYQYYLIQHGYTKSKNKVGDKTVTVYFYKGKSFVALEYAIPYNEVWILAK